MTVRIRNLLPAAVLAACLAGLAQGQSYPSRPVRLVVPFPPGGATDVVARIVAQKLGERLGQQVVVDNRSGASGAIGSEIVVKAAPDGHTLLGVSNSYATNAALSTRLAFDPQNDLAPVSLLGIAPLILVAHPSVQARTVGELVALARAKPGAIKFASSGAGSGPHLSGELLRSMAKIDITHVPYKGSGPALIETIGGQVEITFISLLVARPYIQTGKLRFLAVGTQKRSRAAPEVPSVSEAIPGFESTTWYGILGPAKLPAALMQQLSTELARVIAAPDVTERLAGDGVEPAGSSPEAFRRHLATEIAKWRAVGREAGVRVD